MSDFNAKLIPCFSTVSGEKPSIGDLRIAEIAINTADGKLFTRHTDGTIKEISGSGGGGGGGSIDEIEDIGNIQPRPGVDPAALGWLWDVPTASTPAATSEWQLGAADPFPISLFKERKDGTDVRGIVAALPATGTLWIANAADGVDLTGLPITAFTALEYSEALISGDVVNITLADPSAMPPLPEAQLVLTFSDPTVPGESFDGDVLIYDADLGKWVPQQLTLDSISDIDTLSTAHLADWYQPAVMPTGMAMVWNSTEGRWEPGYPILSQGKNTSGITGSGRQTDGPNDRRFVDDAEATEAGWTVESAQGDDSAPTIPVPADFQASTFFNQALGATIWVNTNGGVGIGSAPSAGRSGNVAADAGTCPLYLGFWSADTFLRKTFTKVVGTEWRVRLEFSYPFNQIPGYVIELHFGKANGIIYVIYGKQQAGATPLVAGGLTYASSGLVLNGEMNIATWMGWPALPTDGNCAYLVGTEEGDYVTPGRGLGDLADVVLSEFIAPGSSLVYDPANDYWRDGPNLIQWVNIGKDPLADQVVLLMNFEDDLTDETGNQVIPVAGWTFAAGKFGKALDFVPNQQLNFPSQTGLSFTGDFCIEYWVRHDTVAGEQGHLSKRASSWAVGDWCIEVTDGLWRWMVNGATGGNTIDAGTLTAGTWHHIAIARQGTTLRLFQDGVLLVEQEAYGIAVTGGANAMRLGRAFSPDGYLDGQVDGLRITNGAARYTAPFSVPDSPPSLEGGSAEGWTPTLPIDIHTDVDTSTDPPEDGEALVWDEALGQWVPKPMPAPGGGQKQTLETRTAPLAPGERTVIEFQTAGGAGILQKLTVDLPVWLVLYDSQEALLADWDRVMSVDPQVDSGVITELIATEAGSWTVTPSPSYLLGADEKIHGKVVSLHDTEATILTTLDLFALG